MKIVKDTVRNTNVSINSPFSLFQIKTDKLVLDLGLQGSSFALVLRGFDIDLHKQAQLNSYWFKLLSSAVNCTVAINCS